VAASHNANSILVYERSMLSKITNKMFWCHDKRVNGIRTSIRFVFERLKELHLYYKVILIEILFVESLYTHSSFII